MNDDLLNERLLHTAAAQFIMTNENAELFAWYGQAVALAQLLEIELLGYVTALPPSSKDRRKHPDKHRRYLENLDRATLGNIRDEMRRYPKLKAAAADLDAVNELRIDVIHTWFRSSERMSKMSSPQGRSDLVAELQAVVDRLGTVVAIVGTSALLVGYSRKEAGGTAAPSEGT